jgi:L-lactate dehydrogenase complex protein LldG
VVHGPAPGPEVLDLVLSILRELHAHQLVAWGADELPVLGIGDALIERGFQFLDDALPLDRHGRAAQLAKLDQADVGLTGALAGLADTGTIVMASGSGRPRLSWLLPPVHVALLPLERLYASLDDFLSRSDPAVRASANVALVTGPSRSGDIEMILTRGVHGPGAVHVVLVS